jgi:hypothetical protein
VLRHELGHAFDMALGGQHRFFSSRVDFVNAYQRDVRDLSQDERETFRYYLQGSRAGWQESFAEAFAVSLGGGSSDMEPEEFEAAFPHVMAYVRHVIEAPPKPAAAPKLQAARGTVRVGSQTPVRGRLFRRR